MIPDKVVEIFVSATAAYETVISKATFTDIDWFEENVNYILEEF